MKTSKPTRKQIAENINWLEANRDNVRHYSSFGDNHRANIDAALDVLRDDLMEDEIYNRSNEEGEGDDSKEWTFQQRDTALSTRRWMDGHEPISPKKSYKSLVEKPI